MDAGEALALDDAATPSLETPLPKGRRRKSTREEQRLQMDVMEVARLLAREGNISVMALLAAADLKTPFDFDRAYMSNNQAAEYVQWLRDALQGLLDMKKAAKQVPPLEDVSSAVEPPEDAEDMLTWTQKEISNTIVGLAQRHGISVEAVRQRVVGMSPGHLEGIEKVHPLELSWYCGVIEGAFDEGTPVVEVSE